MPAFLKRRWFLLSCAVALLPCSLVDLSRQYESSAGNWSVTRTVGLHEGNFVWYDESWTYDFGVELPPVNVPLKTSAWPPPKHGVYVTVHRPDSGGVPSRTLHESNWRYEYSLQLPLWLPLSAILGWIVIRELRWREKRSKSAESCGTN